jgi:hypothetical protein
LVFFVDFCVVFLAVSFKSFFFAEVFVFVVLVLALDFALRGLLFAFGMTDSCEIEKQKNYMPASLYFKEEAGS